MALVDEVGEINVASAFEVYSVSYAARTVAIATGNTVTTEHGVVVATLSAEDAPRLDRVVVPGAHGQKCHRPTASGLGRQA